nr:hypothetical protein [Fodinicola feengrottensis]
MPPDASPDVVLATSRTTTKMAAATTTMPAVHKTAGRRHSGRGAGIVSLSAAVSLGRQPPKGWAAPAASTSAERLGFDPAAAEAAGWDAAGVPALVAADQRAQPFRPTTGPGRRCRPGPRTTRAPGGEVQSYVHCQAPAPAPTLWPS